MDLVQDRGSMDPVHESGLWTRSKEGVHGPLVHVLSSPIFITPFVTPFVTTIFFLLPVLLLGINTFYYMYFGRGPLRSSLALTATRLDLNVILTVSDNV